MDNPKKKIFKVLKFGELEYYINKISTILCLCLFVDNPKKKKNYKVLEFGELEYLRKKKKAFYYIMVLEPGILEYCVAWYSSLPCSSTT